MNILEMGQKCRPWCLRLNFSTYELLSIKVLFLHFYIFVLII